jgi:DeoR/GlpR family transcriptional regulator of sugar metabolism
MSSLSKRLPRFRAVPAALPFRLTERDKAILTWLSRFRVMNSDQMCRAAGGSPQGIRRRLQRLFHHGLVIRHRNHSLSNLPLAYSLTRTGARAIVIPPQKRDNL